LEDVPDSTKGHWRLSGNNANTVEQQPDEIPDGAVFVNSGTLRNLTGENTIAIGFVSTTSGRIEVDAGILRIKREADFRSPGC
jgi:hypothetical protein